MTRARFILALLAISTSCAWLSISLTDGAAAGDPLRAQLHFGTFLILFWPVIAVCTAALSSSSGLRLKKILSRREYHRHTRHAVIRLVALVCALLAASNSAVAAWAIFTSNFSLSTPSALPWANQSAWALPVISVSWWIGSLGRSIWVAPAAGALTATLILLDLAGVSPVPIDQYFTGSSMLSMEPRVGASAILILLALAIGGWMLFAPMIPRHAKMRIAMAYAAMCALVVGGGLTGDMRSDLYAGVDQPSACLEGDGFELCGPRGSLDRVVSEMPRLNETARTMRAMGVEPRDRYEVWTPKTDSSDWIMPYDPGSPGATTDTRTLITGMAVPQSCSFWRAEGKSSIADLETASGFIESVRKRIPGEPEMSEYPALQGDPKMIKRIGRGLQDCKVISK